MTSNNGGICITHAFPSAFVDRLKKRAHQKGLDFPFKRKEVLTDMANAAGWPDAQSFQHTLKQSGERGQDISIGTFETDRPGSGTFSPSLQVSDPVLSSLTSTTNPIGEPGAVERNGMLDIVYGPPGMGKSMFVQHKVLDFAVRHCTYDRSGAPIYPVIRAIGTGPSIDGAIAVLRDRLPAKRQHEVRVVRLTNTADSAINPFDIEPGKREPSPSQAALLIDLVRLLLRPLSSWDQELVTNEAAFASKIVERVYHHRSDVYRQSVPRSYARDVDPVVDAALTHHNIQTAVNATWWDVVDDLLGVGERDAAIRAQRQAVPVLSDILEILADPDLQEAYRDVFPDKTRPESLLDMADHSIRVALKEYDFIASRTRIDTHSSPILAFDLDRVAPQGGPAALRQTVIAHLATRSACRLKCDQIHPTDRQDRGKTPDLLVLDEFHRYGATSEVWDQLRRDAREGRKYDTRLCVATQLETFVDDSILEFVTGLWVLSLPPSGRLVDYLNSRGDRQTASQVKPFLTGPDANGVVPVLGALRAHSGPYLCVYNHHPGAILRKAFETHPDSTQRRDELAESVGYIQACRRTAAPVKADTSPFVGLE